MLTDAQVRELIDALPAYRDSSTENIHAARTTLVPGKPGQKRFKLTDTGNAERLATRYGKCMAFCPTWNTWLTFDGKRWRRDDLREVERLAKTTIRAILVEAQDIDDSAQDLRKAILKHAAASESNAKCKAMIERAEAELAVHPAIFDNAESDFLFNCGNGTIDLKSGKLLPHSRERYITKISDIDFKFGTPCPQFEKFLHEIFADDSDLIAYIQRAVGYSMIGAILDRVMFICWGTGRNGKTVFREILLRLFGDYGAGTPVSTFMERRGDSIPNDLARLAGIRLVMASESEQGHNLAGSLIKSITGGDSITARFLHAEFFDFRPQFKCWLATNHKPEIPGGGDTALWDRLQLIPFTVRIPDEKVIPQAQLISMLIGELPGIFAWAVKGTQEYLQRGLDPPNSVKNATDDYRAEQDRLADFWADCMIDFQQGRIEKGILFDRYRQWALQQQIAKPYGKTNFGRLVANHPGVMDYKCGGVWFWKGIKQK